MLQPKSIVQSETELRELIGSVIKMAKNKKLPVLEPVSKNFIAHSPFLSMSTRQANGGICISAHGGELGFVQVIDDQTMIIPYFNDNFQSDCLKNIEANPDIGLIFLIPVVNETLRINGKAQVVREQETLTEYFLEEKKITAAILVRVEENYLHCAKAFLRSKLWDPATYNSSNLSSILGNKLPIHLSELDEVCQTFIRHSPFLCLGSQSAEGADVSPRGDPPGFVYMPNNNSLLIPDRPGNKIADNFRNILTNSEVGVQFFLPGVDRLLSVSGQASIITDPELLQLLAIQGKCPVVGLWIDVQEVFLAPNHALTRSRLWDDQVRINRKDFPTMGQMIAKQMEFAGSNGEQSAEELDNALDEAYTQRLY